MAKIVLDIQAFEADFFSGMRLYAVGAPGWGDYRFCWLLNRSFGLHFCRVPELDIQVMDIKPGGGTARSLFEWEDEGGIYYFPVFKHCIPFSEASAYVYGNHCLEKSLIPEWRLADYFLLVPDETENGWLSACMRLACVSWMKQVTIRQLKSKRNLIF